MRIYITLLLIAITIPGFAQDYKTDKSGIRYKIHTDVPGPTAQTGDIVVMQIEYLNGDDSLMFSSSADNAPSILQLKKPLFRGDLTDGLKLLSKGDSATFWVSADSMLRYTGVYLFRQGTFVQYRVKIEEIQKYDDFKNQLREKEKLQDSIDSVLINGFLELNNAIANKTPSGVYFIILKAGTGENAKPGDYVSVAYTGMLMDGTVFDDSKYHEGSYNFSLGSHAVIQGWDDVIPYFNKGTIAKVLIPSKLAYGEKGIGKIPANAVLIFDIELLDITKQ